MTPRPSPVRLGRPISFYASFDSAGQGAELTRIVHRECTLFTDIQMPGSMDGLKLAAAVRDRWPPILIVATSGQVKLHPGDLPKGGRFLPKPYSPTES